MLTQTPTRRVAMAEAADRRAAGAVEIALPRLVDQITALAAHRFRGLAVTVAGEDM